MSYVWCRGIKISALPMLCHSAVLLSLKRLANCAVCRAIGHAGLCVDEQPSCMLIIFSLTLLTGVSLCLCHAGSAHLFPGSPPSARTTTNPAIAGAIRAHLVQCKPVARRHAASGRGQRDSACAMAAGTGCVSGPCGRAGRRWGAFLWR